VGHDDALAAAAYALGAISLGGEAAVHVQQYASFLHEVRWIGPLFLANAAACVVAIVGLGDGMFGWHEGGFRTAIAIAVITETCAAILLSGALTTAAVRRHAH
jgi:hypothetical protein